MLIGIGGVSRAGKTTLARLLSELWCTQGQHVITIHQDEHVVSEQELPLIKTKRDWEQPNSIDWASLYGAVKHSLDMADIVIVEGLFCFSDLRLNAMMDAKLFVNIDKSLFVRRKQEDLRWGSAPEPAWYIEHIWTSFLTYGLPEDVNIDLQLDGTEFFDIDAVASAIKKV